MNDNMGVGAPLTERPETLDDIDAAIDAIPDQEINHRLHDVMARALRERLSDLDVASPETLPMVLAGTDAEELLEAKQRLQIIREQIRAGEAKLEWITARRDELLCSTNAVRRLLARTRWNLDQADPGDDPFITEILRLGQEVLDKAKADANRMRDDANFYAARSRDRADWRASWLGPKTTNRSPVADWIVRTAERSRSIARLLTGSKLCSLLRRSRLKTRS